MKKIIFALLFVLGHEAKALSEIEITGEVDALAELYYMPTANQGDSLFRVPSLFLNLNVPLNEGNLLVVEFEGAERTTNEDVARFGVQTREAYFDLVSPFEGMYAVRGGLLPQPWQEAQYEEWSYRFLGETSWAITEKWRYLSFSDIGISFMGELPNDWGEGAFTIMNGQGRDQGELAAHKEAGIFVRLMKSSPWTISLNYTRGNYDQYGETAGVKERAQGQVSYRAAHWWAGLEVLAAKDPADAIQALKMAEEVDVVDFTGESVDALGGSAFLTFGMGERSELMFRYDYLNAVTGTSGKDLSTVIGAYAYRLTEDVRLAFAMDYTKFGNEYFAYGGRERTKCEFAAQVLF